MLVCGSITFIVCLCIIQDANEDRERTRKKIQRIKEMRP